MHILIDAILILVFFITVIHYYRVGFVKALFSVCKVFLSIVIALSLASPVGAIISDKFIHTPVKAATDKMIDGLTDGNGESIADLLEKLPDTVKNLVLSSDTLTDELENEIAKIPLDNNNIGKISNAISDKISIVISSIIAFLIIFAISMILFTILAFVLNKICSLPVLKQTNKLLGCVLGILFGIINVFASSTIITLVLHLISVANPEVAVNKVSENAIVYSFIESIDLSQIILKFFRLG